MNSVFVYLGDHVTAFEREFARFGPVVGKRSTWFRTTNAAGTSP